MGTYFNGGTYYLQSWFSSGGSTLYFVWADPGFTTSVNSGVSGGDYLNGFVTYGVTSTVTAKEYSFVLEEASNDLKILVDGSLHSTIKANGEIHNASGSKYITEADFNGLFDARLANATIDGGSAGAAATPDFDGGTASTTSFDFTVDGGDASTTSFADAYEGGNAAGNSIVAGGFSGTTVYGSTEDGGNASTTSFDQTIDGGNA